MLFMLCRRTALLFLSLAPPLWCIAQNVDLLTGSVVVEPGTTLRFNGPITWTLSPGTSVENNGVIDLGAEAIVEEAIGAPIHGTGEERAIGVIQGPFADQEPGGLGLFMSTADPVDGVGVIRRHLPIALPEGDESIRRWFVVDASAAAGSAMTFVLMHDATELNGLQASELSLYRSADMGGPWTELTSINDAPAHTTTATDFAPWHLITAFANDAVTGMPEKPTINGFRVWPTAATDVLHVAPLTGELIRSLEILDGVGRMVWTMPNATTETWCSVDLSSLHPGAYMLRVNGEQVVKFVKA